MISADAAKRDAKRSIDRAVKSTAFTIDFRQHSCPENFNAHPHRKVCFMGA